MNNKKLLVITLILIATLISGCVYYRLLKFKWQLEKFEENFELQDKKGLTLVFLNPVLLKKDITWLMNNEPPKKSDDNENTWIYILTKKNKGDIKEKRNFDIDIMMDFEKDKLKEFTLPKRFLENLSKEMLAKMFKSMGKAKVDKQKKQADSVLKGAKTGMPTIYDVLYTLGEPYEKKEEEKNTKLKYIYNLKEPDDNSELKPFDLIFDFEINNEDKVLRKSDVNINGLKMSMGFEVD